MGQATFANNTTIKLVNGASGAITNGSSGTFTAGASEYLTITLVSNGTSNTNTFTIGGVAFFFPVTNTPYVVYCGPSQTVAVNSYGIGYTISYNIVRFSNSP